MRRNNAARAFEAVAMPKGNPTDRKTAAPNPKAAEYDVLVVGGGPAGLAAASYCGKKLLRTAVFEGDLLGGVLTRWCPDKRIENYPGVSPGILAKELAALLIDEARRSGVDLIEGRVEEITPGREVVAKGLRAKTRMLILANGSIAAEARILREREFAGRPGGVYYNVRDPADFRGKNVVIVGGGETAISHVQRLSGIASRITLVHRQSTFRIPSGLPGEFERDKGIAVLLQSTVEEFLGDERVGGVRVRDHRTGRDSVLPADAVVLAVGRKPNTAIFRDLGLSLDGKGQIETDLWQRTNVPGILAVGDVSSHLRMIVTAVAQAATAAHRAYLDIRTPYWK
jgi:thioredoxin reductase (NADPH)